MTGKKVSLGDIARGALHAAPEYLHGNTRGLLNFATLRSTSKRSIGRVYEHWARQAPNRIGLCFEGRSWTYREFNGWVNRIAASFAAHGVKSGDVVAILMENRPTALACVVAATKLGAIAGMLNHNQRGDVLAHSIGLVKPRLLVLSAECLEALQTTPWVPEQTRSLAFLWHGGDAQTAAPAGWTDLDRDAGRRSSLNPSCCAQIVASQPCYYIFTSGTTGLPKASVMTHYRWLSSMGGLGNAALRIRASDVFYCCLPLYHNNALTVSLSCTLSAGATFALDRKFSASRFWDRIRLYDATAFAYIGELLRYLLNKPETPRDRHHHVRLITGNGLRPEIWEAFEKRFGISRIYEFYGASESNIAFVNAFGVSQTAGFTPMSFAIVAFDNDREEAVRDAQGFMRKVKHGGIGLLLSEVTSKRPFDGYTDPEAGNRKLLHGVFKPGDCWFNTGDLVRDQGLRHIQFVDRVGDTFRWKGENVATGEVEGVLARIANVEQGAVYGVTVPGCDGRAGMAALTLSQGAEFDGAALARTLTEALPAYAVPVFLRLRKQAATTGTFKYRKVELKQEGFNIARAAEPLYVLVDRGRGYEKLTQKLYRQINDGKLRL
ncbi:MAG: long-chain-acyl-CoA synthetase [Nevskiaceae bacterium]|nr:MAG: long-chain-acyl-CoA synthetase [Nevskiaceae bacterium]TBR74728.1 MAG: long-chain-acyl-CoA synthetase [Nevskiaceae bacterium]